MKQDTQLRRTMYVAAGLSEKEALLYDLLLKRGEMAGAQIEKESGLKKNTYALLKGLTQKRLVLPIQRKYKTHYQVAPPERLVSLIDEKEKGIKETRRVMDELMPGLKSTYAMSVGKPTIRYFEGAVGLRQVFEDIYAPKDEPVYGAVDVDQIEGFIEGFSKRELIPRREKHKLAVKCCFNNTKMGKWLKEHDKEHNRESLLLDKDKYPLPAEIEAYEDKVALMSFKEGDFIGLIIENEDFAVTLRSILKFLFDHMRECPTGQVDARES